MSTAIIGQTGLGKTRLAGTWPFPLWVNGEPDGYQTALKGGKEPPAVDLVYADNPLLELTKTFDRIAGKKIDEDGCIEWEGHRIGSVIWDSFDAFQDIVKVNIMLRTRREALIDRDWGVLESRMRIPLISFQAIKLPTVMISHVQERGEEDRRKKMWWSAQGSIRKRLDRLFSEILHVFLDRDSNHWIATQPFVDPATNAQLLAKDRHNRLRPLANKHGLINITGEDGYPPYDVANTILGRANAQS